jgi:hypothetical protein
MANMPFVNCIRPCKHAHLLRDVPFALACWLSQQLRAGGHTSFRCLHPCLSMVDAATAVQGRLELMREKHFRLN